MSIVIALRYRLIELKVSFFDLSDCLRRLHQVPSQLFLNTRAGSVHQSDILKLLIIVSSTFFLLCIHLPDNSIDLVGELASETIEVELAPRLRTIVFTFRFNLRIAKLADYIQVKKFVRS